MHRIEFSLLVTVYKGIRKEWLQECFVSIREQDKNPAEIVIVKDGPISAELEKSIAHWQGILPLKQIRLPKNLGAGGAALAGFAHCSFPWIARMDADDIAEPTRFHQQLSYLEKYPSIDVLGGQIAEFDADNKIQTFRKVPLSHQEIAALMPSRCPINNTSVIFRKDNAQKAGGYEDLITHEDYFLWYKMLKTGALFNNMPSVLVKVRMGTEAYQRRRGIPQVKQEMYFQKKLRERKYISQSRYLLNIGLRVLPRFLPTLLLKAIYRLFLRSS